jgi:hypothetical protein
MSGTAWFLGEFAELELFAAGLRQIRNATDENRGSTPRAASPELLDGAAKRRLVSVLPQVGGVAMMA